MAKYAIYRLMDPDTGATRYIGRTSNGTKRIRAHLIPSVLKKAKFPVDRWCAKLVAVDKEPAFDFLEEFEHSENLNQILNDAEEKWRLKFKDEGCSLLNCVPCGGGTLGWKHTDEARRKMREAWKTREPAAQVSRGRMSEAGKKRWARERPKWSKQVRCIEDNLVFQTMKEAGKYYGVSGTAVSRECDGSTHLKKTIGKTFERLNTRAKKELVSVTGVC